jgi:hypothetical protein
MTSKFLSNISLKCRNPYLLSAAVLSTTLFMGTAAIAGSGSTSLDGISGDADKSTSHKADSGAVQSITATQAAECPLNSGGPSLLGTTWWLNSIYGTKVPEALDIDMRVSTTSLTGFSGCNKYSANFKQVGYTGFTVKKINKTNKVCKVFIPYAGAPAINLGTWEGSYIRTIKRMGSVRQVTDTRLHFFNRNGQVGMKFHKVSDENQQAAVVEEKKDVAIVSKTAAVEKKPAVKKGELTDEELISQFYETTKF